VHLYLVSEWSALCTDSHRVDTCTTSLRNPDAETIPGQPDYGWTDLTYLLHKHGVSWRYYVEQGTQPDCDDGAIVCGDKPQRATTPEIWNPLPDFVTVHENKQLGNIQEI